MPRFLIGLFIFALAVYAVSDVIASTDQRRGNTPKFLWIIITLLIPVLGPIIWIVFSNSRRGGQTSTGPNVPPYKPRPKPMNSGPLAPDDDPDFLWKLEAERRRREAEERKKNDTQDDK